MSQWEIQVKLQKFPVTEISSDTVASIVSTINPMDEIIVLCNNKIKAKYLGGKRISLDQREDIPGPTRGKNILIAILDSISFHKQK